MPSLQFYTVMSDVANILAGLSLTTSFSLITAGYTFSTPGVENDHFLPGHWGANWIQYTMCAEGLLWFLGGFALCKLFMQLGQATNAVSQALIAMGGLFFFVSGWNAPIYIVSIKYLIPVGSIATAGNAWLTNSSNNCGGAVAPLLDVASSCPFYGITCFMVATTTGLIGVSGLPKNKLISPFWGITFFFLGAWTIGVFALWGPMLLGGLKTYEDYGCILDAPIANKYTHPFQVLGAIFLTTGAIIFAVMNNSPPPPASEPLVEAAVSA